MCCSNLVCIEVTYKCCETDQGLNMQFLISSKFQDDIDAVDSLQILRSSYTKGLFLKEMTIFVNHPVMLLQEVFSS